MAAASPSDAVSSPSSSSWSASSLLAWIKREVMDQDHRAANMVCHNNNYDDDNDNDDCY